MEWDDDEILLRIRPVPLQQNKSTEGDDADRHHHHHHHRRRRRCCIPIFFFWCCCCCTVALAVVAIALGAADLMISAQRSVAAPPTPCNYSEWSAWGIECLETEPLVYQRIRTMFATPPWDYCPQLYDYDECGSIVLGECLWQYHVEYTVHCFYDEDTNLCEGSNWILDTSPFCVTNASNLTDYYSHIQSVGWSVFQFDLSFPCYAECGPSDAPPTPAPPPPPPCEYVGWSEWSLTCTEYPPGTYAQFRGNHTDPALDNCPTFYEYRPCETENCNTTFQTQNFTFGCTYNSTTHFCISSSKTTNTYTWCATNATNLTNFFEEVVPNGQTDFIFGITPCVPECPVTNGSTPFTPVPSGGSPPAACTYTAWGSWSSICGEYPEGVFTQWRVRQPSPQYSYCLDTLERQNCSTADCVTWQQTLQEVDCQYLNNTATCNSSTLNITTIPRCNTNATNLTLYLEEVPGGTPSYNVTTDIQPCLTECPSVAPCSYSEWGPWSGTCFEYPPGTYQQARVRVVLVNETLNPNCTDVLERQDCSLDSCINMTMTNNTPSCTYDPLSGQCITSSVTTTVYTVCTTNATNLTDYLAAYPWPGQTTFQFGYTPCVPECAAWISFPSPAPPPPAPCDYSTSLWSPWSFQCVEYPPGVYKQYRTKSALPEQQATCAQQVQRRNCQGNTCQLQSSVNTTIGCLYNSSNQCFRSTIDEVHTQWCATNATNLTAYYLAVLPFSFDNFFLNFSGCPDACPPVNTTNQTASVSIPPIQVVVPVPLITSFCLPPQYKAPNGSCINCTGPDFCHVGVLNPQTQICTVSDRCDDNDPCTIDTCDDVHLTCSYTGRSDNLLNATIVYSCNQSTGIILLDGQTNLTVLSLNTNCDDGDPTTVDSYNPNIQRCVNQKIVNDTALTVIECIDEGAYVANPNTLINGVISNGFYTCANPSQICVSGSCVYARDISPKCYYTAPVLADNAVGEVVGTIANIVFQTVYDDSKCPLDIPGKTYASCNPFALAGLYTLTGCCQCGSPLTQGFIVFLTAADCICCQSDSDCEDFAHCNTVINKCELDL